MDIEELLDDLQHKIYGKEVRQGFVDSIRQCYKDATGNPESVVAVVEDNKKMQEHLDNTPYTIMEEGEPEDLPIHTINDEEISTESTWSSEKVNAKLDEVFQAASNGKKTLAAAIGNGATADMSFDQLANKILQIDYSRKETTNKDGVYFDKAFNTVLIWVVVGCNSAYERTGYVYNSGYPTDDSSGTLNISGPNDYINKSSYLFTDLSESKLHAKTYDSGTNTETWYECYQIGYN